MWMDNNDYIHKHKITSGEQAKWEAGRMMNRHDGMLLNVAFHKTIEISTGAANLIWPQQKNYRANRFWMDCILTEFAVNKINRLPGRMRFPRWSTQDQIGLAS